MSHGPTRLPVAIRRSLASMAASQDVVVATTDELARRGKVVGSILEPALREGRVLYERA